MRAKVIRKKKAEWPEKFRRAQKIFLPQAAFMVEGQAKALAPVDNGRLRSSINSNVGDEEATVGTNVEYATHVEYGTRPHTINSPVKIQGVGWRYIGQHPGTRAQPFMRPALDENRKALVRLFRDIIKDVFRGR